MPTHVKVYPTKASALNVKHPHGPKMAVGGVMWPQDSFTGRRLSDGSVTENEAKAYTPVEKASGPDANPAPASPPPPLATIVTKASTAD